MFIWIAEVTDTEKLEQIIVTVSNLISYIYMQDINNLNQSCVDLSMYRGKYWFNQLESR